MLLDSDISAKYRKLALLPTPGACRAAALADELSLLTLLFAITGLPAVLQRQALFPSRRDFLALAALPVRPSQVFAARFAAVLLFSIALLITVNVLPSILTPLQRTGRWQRHFSYSVNLAAQASACGLGCFFVFFAVVGLQGLLLIVLPRRLFVRISGYVQGLLVAVLLFAGLLSWSISDWTENTLARLPQVAGWAPPVWFTGLHEAMLGDQDPFFGLMADRALLAPAAAFATALLAYPAI